MPLNRQFRSVDGISRIENENEYSKKKIGQEFYNDFVCIGNDERSMSTEKCATTMRYEEMSGNNKMVTDNKIRQRTYFICEPLMEPDEASPERKKTRRRW